MAQRSRQRASSQTQAVISGSNIRLEQAKSPRGAKKPASQIVVNLAQDYAPGRGFFGFLRQHAVVGLVIGFVIGTQVQSLVKQLVQSFLDPLTHLLFGTALSARTFTLHFHNRAANFAWGAMAYALIIFLLVLLTMYFVVKSLQLEKLEEKTKEKD